MCEIETTVKVYIDNIETYTYTSTDDDISYKPWKYMSYLCRDMDILVDKDIINKLFWESEMYSCLSKIWSNMRKNKDGAGEQTICEHYDVYHERRRVEFCITKKEIEAVEILDPDKNTSLGDCRYKIKLKNSDTFSEIREESIEWVFEHYKDVLSHDNIEKLE